MWMRYDSHLKWNPIRLESALAWHPNSALKLGSGGNPKGLMPVESQ